MFPSKLPEICPYSTSVCCTASISRSAPYTQWIVHSGFGSPSSGVASPKKVGGPNYFSLLSSVNSRGGSWSSFLVRFRGGVVPGTPPPIYKTLLNGFAQISGRVWTEVGGSGPPIPPVATPLSPSLYMVFLRVLFLILHYLLYNSVQY